MDGIFLFPVGMLFDVNFFLSDGRARRDPAVTLTSSRRNLYFVVKGFIVLNFRVRFDHASGRRAREPPHRRNPVPPRASLGFQPGRPPKLFSF